ncbi:hypothetical protein C8A05DRAFT_44714 [Staphylotrichum tortipilum]|uniref:Uncharacterized protein n=1 Tax=Staphylotrichum tortipilum TaxID=2831512 RepID=A0AAN6MIT5_9PEZI|nr:hypothetical protein C8A05DRAFT_44714 [Staphylotrichum longicolle]
MARRKKSGVPKIPHSASSAPAAEPAAIAAPSAELTHVPPFSPYGSPACTIPFASPLTLPLDILKKSPKLHAAYESRLRELPAIPEDVGHVLVHYLHTGTYGSLKPRPTDAMSKQSYELKTSIQAYAAARAYDLPDLMRLAEARIGKYGEGLPLPSLLEVARDAYPTLTESDGWFLDYLRSRIRPHLQDPKLLLGSNLLDQISSILSPNRVLLRTVLELFCERIVVRPEPATPPAASTIASPITSPGSSRSVSPLPPASPPSLDETRLRSTPQDEVSSTRKNPRATPWPSPENIPETSWARSTPQEPLLPEPATPRLDETPSPDPIPVFGKFPESGPVIIDVVPPPGPSIGDRAVVEHQPKPAHEPEAGVDTEPAVRTSAFAETVTSEAVPAAQREGEGSGKDIDREPPSRELEPIPKLGHKLEIEPFLQPKVHGPILREADSGFWEAPDFEPRKEQARSLLDLEPVVVVTPEPTTHELESIASSSQIPGTDTRDFAASGADAKNKTDRQAKTVEAPQDLAPAPLLGDDDSVLAAAAENWSKTTVESEPNPEPVPTTLVEELPEKVADAPGLVTAENAAADESLEASRKLEAEAQPETEKAPEATEEFEAMAKSEPEPEPEANPPVPARFPDAAQPPRATEPETAQPSVESGPEPVGKLEVQRVNTDPGTKPSLRVSDVAMSTAVLKAKPAPEQESSRTEAGDSGAQPCSSQVKQRNWKKRFISLRYPTLLGRGM